MNFHMRVRVMFVFCAACFAVQSLSAWGNESSGLQKNSVANVSQDQNTEAKIQRISEELRCLVCDNQTLAESKVGLALRLRKQIREMAIQGLSDEAIIQDLLKRNADYVSYRPPRKITTLLMYFAPTALLLLVGVSLLIWLRRWEKMTVHEVPSLNEAEKTTELLI